MPEVADKEMLLSGNLERRPKSPGAPQIGGSPTIPFNGVVATQGNRQNGYGLYLLNDTLHFQVNQNGKTYQVISSKELPDRFSFKAALGKDGTMQLFINNEEVGTAKAAGLFKKDFDLPLRVSFDNRKGEERVAAYPDSLFFLRAYLTNAKLETLEGISTPTAAPKTTQIDKVIVVKVLKNVMKFDKQLLTAKAGTTIQVVLQNPDFMQHNWVLTKPKMMEKVGAAADKLVQNPNGAKMNYVPRIPEVLTATPLINPGGKYTLTVKIPDTPGDYPYVCTFPGHWRIMNGVLRVTK
jgi:azurin